MKPMIVLALVFLAAALMGFQAACTSAPTKVYSIPEMFEELYSIVLDSNKARAEAHIGTEYSWQGRITEIGSSDVEMVEHLWLRRVRVSCRFEDPEPFVTLNEGDEVVLRGDYARWTGDRVWHIYIFENCELVETVER